jgi:HSP20 family molecular chaperone IbpA
LKKEDVKVEVSDGHLAISGERKRESEEKKDSSIAANVSTAASIAQFRCPKA